VPRPEEKKGGYLPVVSYLRKKRKGKNSEFIMGGQKEKEVRGWLLLDKKEKKKTCTTTRVFAD